MRHVGYTGKESGYTAEKDFPSGTRTVVAGLTQKYKILEPSKRRKEKI